MRRMKMNNNENDLEQEIYTWLIVRTAIRSESFI